MHTQSENGRTSRICRAKRPAAPTTRKFNNAGISNGQSWGTSMPQRHAPPRRPARRHDDRMVGQDRAWKQQHGAGNPHHSKQREKRPEGPEEKITIEIRTESGDDDAGAAWIKGERLDPLYHGAHAEKGSREAQTRGEEGADLDLSRALAGNDPGRKT